MTKYEEYQLQWMIDNGHSLTDFVNELISCADEVSTIEPEANLAYCIKEGFYDFANDRGFGGELWACKSEWEDHEGEKQHGINRNNVRYCKDFNRSKQSDS